MKYRTLPASLPAHFWDRVEATGFCWNWRGTIGTDGYGRIVIEGAPYLAHRASYAAMITEPGDQQIDHLCRNRRCVNPDHLELVTVDENVRRGFSPSAVNGRRTACIHGHEFDEANTLHTPRGRRCRTCSNARMVRYNRKKRLQTSTPVV